MLSDFSLHISQIPCLIRAFLSLRQRKSVWSVSVPAKHLAGGIEYFLTEICIKYIKKVSFLQNCMIQATLLRCF